MQKMDGEKVGDSRKGDEKKKSSGVGGPLQFNHRIFSFVRDIIYINPL